MARDTRLSREFSIGQVACGFFYQVNAVYKIAKLGLTLKIYHHTLNMIVHCSFVKQLSIKPVNKTSFVVGSMCGIDLWQV